MAVFLYAETAQKSGSVGFGVPAFEFGEFFLEFGGADAVFVGEVGFCVEGVFFLNDIPELGVAHQDGVEHGAVVEFEVVLLKHAHALARAHRYGAVGWAELVGEDSHQGGFAGPVGSDDAVAVARREFQVYVLKQYSFTELDS